ncbi:MAG: DUF1822 family protein, partial [Jaaginema sp. PMC 1079.18]|nr:DUF1822 family protein [Jaaginema sp. PMC 1079.18]
TLTSDLTLPITEAIRQTAHQFATEQTNGQKAFTIYINTIATRLIQNYLTYLDIASYFCKSDLAQPKLRTILNPADLQIANFGQVECRVLLENQTEIKIPATARNNRQGCFVLQLNESLQTAALLGYYPAVNNSLPAQININQLQSIETFITAWEAVQPPQTCLAHWLNHCFTETWQAFTTFMTPQRRVLDFRQATICRAKVLDLGTPLILAIALEPSCDRRLNVQVELLPYHSCESYGLCATLPQSLYLTILTITGEVFRCLNSQSGEQLIQYQFVANPGEKFSLKIESDSAVFTESFIA